MFVILVLISFGVLANIIHVSAHKSSLYVMFMLVYYNKILWCNKKVG